MEKVSKFVPGSPQNRAKMPPGPAPGRPGAPGGALCSGNLPGGGKNRKNDPEILLGRSWPRPKFCFWPPVASKSALGAILRALKTGFGADFGFEAFFDQFWERFGSIFDRRNLIIHWQGQ